MSDNVLFPGGMPPVMPEELEDVSDIPRKFLDIPYGSAHPRQVFDLYLPQGGEAPYPVLVHFHGGGFAIGDKRDFHIRPLLECLEHGIAVASCNYRRSGDAPFPAAVLDCRSFVCWLKDHGREYGVDPDRICAFGGSAGGNLSALFAMEIPQFYGEDTPRDCTVKCAVDWFGPTDFRQMDAQARANGVSFADHDLPHSPESKYAGGALQTLDPEYLALANPITYISDAMCPMLVQHGKLDKLVPYQQSEILVQAIREKLGDGRVTFLPLETADHDDPLYHTPENHRILFDFLAAHL